MTERHILECNQCSKELQLEFNGERHLPESGWAYLYDLNKGGTTGEGQCQT